MRTRSAAWGGPGLAVGALASLLLPSVLAVVPLSASDWLLEAAAAGDLERVKRLVQAGEAGSPRDPRGGTALHLAAAGGHLEVAQYLVSAGEADVSAEDDRGRTPLHEAASGGHLPVVKFLVGTAKADVAAVDSLGKTPLHLAAHARHLEVVQYLVEVGKADVSARDGHGRTALHLAASAGALSVVEFLVGSAHAEVEARDNDGRTPLFLAVVEGRPEVVRWLVGTGKADVCVTDTTEKKVTIAQAAEGGDAEHYLAEDGGIKKCSDNRYLIPALRKAFAALLALLVFAAALALAGVWMRCGGPGSQRCPAVAEPREGTLAVSTGETAPFVDKREAA